MGELTDLYEKLLKDGKTTMENILKLMGNAAIVLDNKSEETAKKVNEATKKIKVELTKYEELLRNIMKEKLKSIKELKENEKQQAILENMEKSFRRLEAAGKNTVENLMLWMKDAKVVVDKNAEVVAKKLHEVSEKGSVQMAKFKEVIYNIAEEKKQKVEEVTKQLLETNDKFWDALLCEACDDTGLKLDKQKSEAKDPKLEKQRSEAKDPKVEKQRSEAKGPKLDKQLSGTNK